MLRKSVNRKQERKIRVDASLPSAVWRWVYFSGSQQNLPAICNYSDIDDLLDLNYFSVAVGLSLFGLAFITASILWPSTPRGLQSSCGILNQKFYFLAIYHFRKMNYITHVVSSILFGNNWSEIPDDVEAIPLILICLDLILIYFNFIL